MFPFSSAVPINFHLLLLTSNANIESKWFSSVLSALPFHFTDTTSSFETFPVFTVNNWYGLSPVFPVSVTFPSSIPLLAVVKLLPFKNVTSAFSSPTFTVKLAEMSDIDSFLSSDTFVLDFLDVNLTVFVSIFPAISVAATAKICSPFFNSSGLITAGSSMFSPSNVTAIFEIPLASFAISASSSITDLLIVSPSLIPKLISGLVLSTIMEASILSSWFPFSATIVYAPSFNFVVSKLNPTAVASTAGMLNVAVKCVSIPAESPIVCHASNEVSVLVLTLSGSIFVGI